jgi:DNA-binding transcriptional ArsR family regulator
MDQIYALQAEVLKTLSSPRRLEIIHVLADGPHEVGRLAEVLGISQPNASQHLSVMRAAGLVEGERDGREVHYRLSDPDIIVACDIMKGVLQRRIARLADLSAEHSAGPVPASTADGARGIPAPGAAT